MLRPLSVLCSLALAFSASAQDLSASKAATAPVADGTASAVPQARVRVFSRNDIKVSLRRNAARAAGPDDLIVVSGEDRANLFGGIRAVLAGNESQSIGMPVTEAVRRMNDKAAFGSKPFYREFALAAGPVLSASFSLYGNKVCVPASMADRPYANMGFIPEPTLQFTPEPGIDYELLFGLDTTGCAVANYQILADGRAVALPREFQRGRSRKTLKVEGPHLHTLLFRPGSVYHRDVGESADLQMRADTEEQADAFDSVLQTLAERPGTRLCIVQPAVDYHSALQARLSRFLAAQGDAMPAIYEPIDGVRGALRIEDDVPTTFQAAAAYCQLAAVMAFDDVATAPPSP